MKCDLMNIYIASKLIFNSFLNFRINHTVILDDPYDDPSGLVIPDRSPEPTKEQLDVSGVVYMSICPFNSTWTPPHCLFGEKKGLVVGTHTKTSIKRTFFWVFILSMNIAFINKILFRVDALERMRRLMTPKEKPWNK